MNENLELIQSIRAKDNNIYRISLMHLKKGEFSEFLLAIKLEHCKLRHIKIQCSGIGDKGVKELSKVLKSKPITSIDLVDNNIKEDGARALATILKKEEGEITYVNLACNKLGEKGIKSLAEALNSVYSKVTVIDLASNRIKDAEVKFLADAISSKHCKLEYINLRSNKIKDVGAKFLADAIKSEYCNILSISLWDNDIGDAGAEALAEAISSGRSRLTVLNLADNNIGDAGAKALAEAIKSKQCKITSFNLEGNNIGDEGLKAIEDAIKYNKNIIKYNEENTKHYISATKLAESLISAEDKMDIKALLEQKYAVAQILKAEMNQHLMAKCIISLCEYLEETQEDSSTEYKAEKVEKYDKFVRSLDIETYEKFVESEQILIDTANIVIGSRAEKKLSSCPPSVLASIITSPWQLEKKVEIEDKEEMQKSCNFLFGNANPIRALVDIIGECSFVLKEKDLSPATCLIGCLANQHYYEHIEVH